MIDDPEEELSEDGAGAEEEVLKLEVGAVETPLAADVGDDEGAALHFMEGAPPPSAGTAGLVAFHAAHVDPQAGEAVERLIELLALFRAVAAGAAAGAGLGLQGAHFQ